MARRAFASIAPLLLVALLGSCGGDGPTAAGGGDPYLRFRANGSLVEFTQQTSLLGTFGATNLVVSGANGLSNAGVRVYDTSPITTTTYSGYTVSGAGLVGALLHYHTGSVLFQPGVGGPVDVTVTIAEITGDRVRGTFSGTLSATGEPDLAITEGQFLVVRVN